MLKTHRNPWLKFSLLVGIFVFGFYFFRPAGFAQINIPPLNNPGINTPDLSNTIISIPRASGRRNTSEGGLALEDPSLLEDSGIVIDKSLGETLLTMVNYFTGFLGFLATVVFIYAGVLWVLNLGNDELITKARKMMTYAVLGFIVIMLSYGIVRFITSSTGDELRVPGGNGECTYDFDCPDSQWCQFDRTVGESRCTENVRDLFENDCRVSSDCSEENEVCAGGACVTPGEVDALNLECVNAEECNFVAGDVCWNNVCQTAPNRPRAPFECLGSFHCTAGQYCLVGRCRQTSSITCDTNNDCEAPRTCDNGFCRNPDSGSGSTCQNSSDCAINYVCNETTNRCDFQGLGGTGGFGVSSSTTMAASERNLGAIDDFLGQLDSALEGISEAMAELSDEDREAVRQALGQGSLLDKFGRLENLLDNADDPASVRVLERLTGALGYLISVREEADELREVMPETTETIEAWNETSKALDDLIDDPQSGIKLRRFETLYRRLREMIRKFPVVQARLTAVPAEGNVPFTVTLDGLDSVDPTGGTISDYRWSYLDNQGNEVALGNEPVIIHEFTEPNTYVVKLQVGTTQRDENGYKTAADGIGTVRITARPPSSSVNFRINGAEIGDVHRVTVKEGQAGLIFDPSSTVPALGRIIKSYEWSFGDTSTETRSTPTAVVHTYQKAGEYFVKLVVTDSHGVKDQRVTKLIVKSLAADISINPKKGNVNTEFQFQGLTSRSDDGSIVQYAWNIEDGKGNSLFEGEDQMFFYRFDRPGEYRVNLLVTDVTGARDNSIETIQVVSRSPVATFNTSIPQPNHPNRVEFDALTSYDPDEGDILKYSWDFDGDGTFELVNSPESRVTYEYKKTGNYKVRLQVQDDFGERNLAEKPLSIDSTLSADIVSSREATQVGQEVKFSVKTANAKAFLWEFGDGETESTEELSVVHTYRRMGRYTVKLHFFDSDDQEGVDTSTLLVGQSDSPVAVISHLVDGRESKLTENLCGPGKHGFRVTRADNVMFSAKNSINTDGSSRLLVYDWRFSEGARQSKKEFTHRFEDLSASGQCQEVTLMVRDEVSGKVSEADKIYVEVANALPTLTDFVVEAPSPSAAVDFDRTPLTPLTVALKAVNPKDSDGVIKRYRWWYLREGDEETKYGVHSTIAPQTQIVITALGQPGIKNRYFFVLEMTDSDGGVLTTLEKFWESSSLEVENGPNLSPVADFTMDKTTILAGDSITFVSKSYDPQGDALPASSFAWDFDGDGQFDDTSSGSQVNRRYQTPGDYKVRLKVTSRGLSTSAVKTIFVEPTQSFPQAAFIYSVSGNSVTFDATSSRFDPNLSDTTLRYEWDFDVTADADGNGTKDDDVESTEPKPVFLYSNAGKVRVRLKVKDMVGAEGVVVREVDLTLSEEERAKNAYKSLFISSPDQPLTHLNVVVGSARLARGGTSDVTVSVINADNSPYTGKIFFEVMEGSGEFMPSATEAKNGQAFTIFRATDPGTVQIKVKATGTVYGDLEETALIYINP